MNTILTLCHYCAEDFKAAPGMRIKPVSRATTEKKKCCEQCRRKGSFERYHVKSGKR